MHPEQTLPQNPSGHPVNHTPYTGAGSDTGQTQVEQQGHFTYSLQKCYGLAQKEF